VTSTRRKVRPTPEFFADLDRQLGDERGQAGEPSRGDFQTHDLLLIVERFATGWDDLPYLIPGRPDYRVLISVGVLVATVSVDAQLAPGWCRGVGAAAHRSDLAPRRPGRPVTSWGSRCLGRRLVQRPTTAREKNRGDERQATPADGCGVTTVAEPIGGLEPHPQPRNLSSRARRCTAVRGESVGTNAIRGQKPRSQGCWGLT